MKANSLTQTDYHDWIAAKRAEAEARGGKPLKYVPSRHNEGFYLDGEDDLPIPRDIKLAPGEIYNPRTGEIVTDCLSIKKMAEELGITSHKLTDEMERQGLVNRMLDFKEVPMICNPLVRKPRYFHTPAVTDWAVEEGLALEIPTERRQKLILITPKGQERLKEAIANKEPSGPKVEPKRQTIQALARGGKTASDIVNLTGFPRSTVFRHLKELQEAA